MPLNRVRTTAVLASAVLTAAGWVAAAPAAGAEVEKYCSPTREINRDNDIKANIALCTETDGKRLTVTMSGDCFMKTIGWTQYDSCRVEGDWRLTRDGTEVAAGDYNVVPYPGPGDYELSATVLATGRTSHSGGSSSSGTVHGTVSVPVTFTSKPSGPRLGASVHATDNRKTLTVVNTGPDKAGTVKLYAIDDKTAVIESLSALNALKDYREALTQKEPDEDEIDYFKAEMEKYPINQVAQTDDPRCVSNQHMSECELGTLASGASTEVVFKAEHASDLRGTITSPDQLGEVTS
uniref:hypothetical protein n=1 Tax=Nocardia suismassiliense TaxID=2077092 RepID=UPI003F493D19